MSTRLSKALFDAIKLNNKVQLVKLIKRGINVNLRRRKDGSTALHRVAKWGDIEFAQILFEAGADIDATDQFSVTPLHTAVESGNIGVASFLIEAGAYIHAANMRGYTPLQLALQCFHADKIRVQRLKAKAKFHIIINDESIPFYKSESGKIWVKLARLLIDAGYNIKAPNPWKTLLHMTAESGNVVIARLLVDAGVNINAIDINGCIPLHAVARTGDMEFARLLVDAGTLINVADNDGITPFLNAVSFDKMEAVRLLIDVADINASSIDGVSPLLIALETCNIEILRLLLDAGVDINARGGAEPFHEVARISHFELEHRRQRELAVLTEESCNALYLKHIVKLKCLGLHVSEENMSYLMEWFDEELRIFERECETEVARMKRQEIHKDYRFCLCDVLTKGDDELGKVLQVEEMRLKLKEVVRQMSYPVYGNMVSMKFERIVKTVEQRVKGRKIIGFIANSVRSIPDECVKMIASNFTDTDMKDLIDNFK